MNILVVSILFGGNYGAGYSAYKECIELSKKGHKLHIVHSEPNIKKYEDGISRYYYIQFHKMPVINILYLKRNIEDTISEILENNKIDVIYLQSLEFGLIDYKIIKGYKIVYFIRGTTKGIEKNKSYEYWVDAIRRFFITKLLIYLEYRCLRWSKKVIVKSDLMKKELVSMYSVRPNKIKVISGGFDKSDFPKITLKQASELKETINQLKKHEKLILFAGRIAPVKGLIYLIEALPEILKVYDAILFVLGAGFFSNYKKIIFQRIKQLQLENNVVFIGKVSQENVYKYISVADLFVVPSTYEPFGMVTIQAANYNIPLIITESVGAIHTLNKYRLLRIVKPHSSKEISSAAIDLLSKQKTSNVNTIKFRDWKNVADNLEKHFKML